MRLLFDQGTPVPLRKHLVQHNVSTVHELGWSQTSNGELLSRAAAAGFEGLVTTDQNLKYQQDRPERHVALAILMKASWPRIEKNIAAVCAQIDSLQAGSYVEIQVP